MKTFKKENNRSSFHQQLSPILIKETDDEEETTVAPLNTNSPPTVSKKRYLTDTDDGGGFSDGEKSIASRMIRLTRGAKKKVFSLKVLQQQKIQQVIKLKAFFTRCLVIAASIIVICMGHLYGAIAIILIASRIYQVVVSQKAKEEAIHRQVLFQHIGWYVYGVTFYWLLPQLFLRRDLF